MKDFFSLVLELLRYRHRGLILVPAILALPAFYAAALLVVPASAGKPWFVHKYSTLLQTMAGAIVAVGIAVALETRSVSRRARVTIREPGLVAVLWTILGEVGALAALSPGLPADLQRPAFRLMIGGAVSGLLALILLVGYAEKQDPPLSENE